MCKAPKVVAIGETGLDYYYTHSPHPIQKKCFIEHIELSKDVKMPVVIHNRNSDNDLLEILKKYKPNGVVNCFYGDINFSKENYHNYAVSLLFNRDVKKILTRKKIKY